MRLRQLQSAEDCTSGVTNISYLPYFESLLIGINSFERFDCDNLFHAYGPGLRTVAINTVVELSRMPLGWRNGFGAIMS